MKKQPQVTALTRQKFIDAFWTLCETKSVRQITAGEVARQAGYNRSTFYQYFTDITDLLRQIEDGLLADMRRQFTDIFSDLEYGDLPENISRNFDTFHLLFRLLNRQIYHLLGPNGDPSFFSRLKRELLPQITDRLGVPADFPCLDYIIAYAYSAAIGYLQYWHEQGPDMPEDQLFELGYQLMTRGVAGTIAGIVRTEKN